MENKSWLFLAICCLIFATSCSPSHYLRKAKRAIKEAEARGIVVDDTVTVEKEIYIDSVQIDTVVQVLPNDTVYLEKERLKVKVIKLPGDTLKIFAECAADTVKIEIPVEINREISAGFGWGKVIMISIIALVVGYILRAIFK